MKFWMPIILISFFSLAVFGFLGANRAMSYEIPCVGDLASRQSCPDGSRADFLSSILHHLSGLEAFSLALVVAAILVLSSRLIFSGRTILGDELCTQSRFSAPENWQTSLRPVTLRRLNWLSLLEKRDPAGF